MGKENDLLEIIKTSKSKHDVLIKYYGYSNKRLYKILNKFIIKNNINVSHFEKLRRFCLFCNVLLIKNGTKFCDSSCAAKYNNSNRRLSVETKIKIGNTLLNKHLTKPIILKTKIIKKRICLICNCEFDVKKTISNKYSLSKTCSKECHSILVSDNSKKVMKERIKSGKHTGWATRNITSYPEQFFIKVLNNNNIKFEHNYCVKQKELGVDTKYNYFLDFYIGDKKIDLEIDGKQHKYRKEHDYERDRLLINGGYIIYRIIWKNINTDNGKQYIKNEIDKFLIFYNSIE